MLPGYKHPDLQRHLFTVEHPTPTHALARNVIGDFVENLTALIFNGKRFKSDSRCKYCPDVWIKGIFIECKAAGRSKQTFIYQGRLEKDKEFAKEFDLVYCIWHHTAYTKRAATDMELRWLFLSKMKAIYLVPFSEILAVIKRCNIKSEQLNSKYGGTNRTTYGTGYRINIRELEPFKLEWELSQELFL